MEGINNTDTSKTFYYSEKGKMVGYTFVRETEEEEPDDENSGEGDKKFFEIFQPPLIIEIANVTLGLNS